MYLRTLSNDELLLHVDNLPESLRTPLVIELANRLRGQRQADPYVRALDAENAKLRDRLAKS
jgi:hypothetical protein